MHKMYHNCKIVSSFSSMYLDIHVLLHINPSSLFILEPKPDHQELFQSKVKIIETRDRQLFLPRYLISRLATPEAIASLNPIEKGKECNAMQKTFRGRLNLCLSPYPPARWHRCVLELHSV